MKTKHGAEFADVRKFISDGQSFTLLTHISPDGDTLGSALALKLLLNALGKTAEVVCSNPVPKIYGFLPESEMPRAIAASLPLIVRTSRVSAVLCVCSMPRRQRHVLTIMLRTRIMPK